jgi:hypothetical protein
MKTIRIGEHTWQATLITDENGEDLFLELPDDLLKQVDWKVGDTLDLQINVDGIFIVKKVIS